MSSTPKEAVNKLRLTVSTFWPLVQVYIFECALPSLPNNYMMVIMPEGKQDMLFVLRSSP